MSNVVTMSDTIDLIKVAKAAGVSFEQARALVAALGELPANTVHRICLAALETERKRSARTARRSR